MISIVIKVFDLVIGLVIVNDFQMDIVGMVYVKFIVYFVFIYYFYEVIYELFLYFVEVQLVIIDIISVIKVKFDLDYVIYGITQFGVVVVNYFQLRFKYMKMFSLEVS